MPPSELLFLILFLILLLLPAAPQASQPCPTAGGPTATTLLLISVTVLAAAPKFSCSLAGFHHCSSHCCLPGSCSHPRCPFWISLCHRAGHLTDPWHRPRQQAQWEPFKAASLLIPFPLEGFGREKQDYGRDMSCFVRPHLM